MSEAGGMVAMVGSTAVITAATMVGTTVVAMVTIDEINATGFKDAAIGDANGFVVKNDMC